MELIDAATITKRSVSGIFALISRTFILNLISFGASLLIFTILTPRDVGIYTAVIAIQRIINFLTDFGLGAALIQKKEELVEGDLTTSFTIQSLVTFFIFLIIALALHPLSSFLKLTNAGGYLLLALSFSIFLSSFKTIPSILLERKINFNKLIIPQIFESLAFNAVLVVLVLKGFGINSFTWAFLASGLLGIPIYYYVSPWKIKFGVNKESLHHLRFGIAFQAKNVLATVKDDLLTVFLVKIISFTEIGYIGFAQRMAFFFYRYFVDSVTKVTFSTFSRIQESKEFLRKTVEKSLFFTSSLMFPILFGIILIMPYVILYFPRWHNKWEPAILSIAFFCLNALVSSMSGILINIMDATGRVKVTLKLMIVWTTLTWILTPLLIFFFGYNGVSIASFLVSLTIGYTIYLAKKVVDFEFIKSIYKPFISSVIMSIIVYSGGKLIVRDFTTLILDVFIGGLVYVFLMYLFTGKELYYDFKKIVSK